MKTPLPSPSAAEPLGAVRDTPQRQAVLAFLTKARRHVSPEDVFRTLRRANPHLGRATVFRTLRILERQGFLTRVTGPEGRHRIELMARRRHHDHMICVGCGRVTEFTLPALERYQSLAARRRGFNIRWHRHELFGQCRDCQRKDTTK